MATKYSPKTPSGLVLCCDNLNDKSYISGSNTIYDLIGNGYSGTISGTPQITGSIFIFDGVDDKIEWTGIYNHQSSSTLECWFCVDTNQSHSAGVIGYELNNLGGYSEQANGGLFVTGTLPEPNTSSAGIEYSLITDAQGYRYVRSAVSKGIWHHTALGKDMSGTMSLWIDGALMGTQTFDSATYAQWPNPGTYLGTNNNFAVGYYNSNNTGLSAPSRYFLGRISTIKIYNRIS